MYWIRRNIIFIIGQSSQVPTLEFSLTQAKPSTFVFLIQTIR